MIYCSSCCIYVWLDPGKRVGRLAEVVGRNGFWIFFCFQNKTLQAMLNQEGKKYFILIISHFPTTLGKIFLNWWSHKDWVLVMEWNLCLPTREMRSCDQLCGTWLILSYKRGFNKRYGHYEITSSGESEKEVQTSIDDLIWDLPLVPRVVFTCEVMDAPSHSSCVLPHGQILRHLVPKIERLRL